MKNFITFAFYEYPAAIHEIKAWEDLKFDKIFFKEKKENNFIIYKLPFDYERDIRKIETLLCIPVKKHFKINFSDVNNYIQDIRNHKSEYLKTLLFGQFDYDTLITIANLVNNLENVSKALCNNTGISR